MIDLIVFVVLLSLGYFFGYWAEQRHYRSIRLREKRLQRIITVVSKLPPAYRPAPKSALVTGSVVISVDYYKRFLAGLRNLVGGRVKSYESLLDRARREAILRMKEQAEAMGASMVFNVKLETASISKGAKGKIGCVEVLAFGTALIMQKQGDKP